MLLADSSQVQIAINLWPGENAGLQQVRMFCDISGDMVLQKNGGT
jgi:hypothetical protein